MKATIILPTTGDRGPVLKYSVASVIQQSEEDWELFIVGDGVNDDTRIVAEELAASDSRIKYFGFPKDSSRGELNRHDLLKNKARGEIVCYLCDRDIWFSNHIELLYRELQSNDIAHSFPVCLKENGQIRLMGSPDMRVSQKKRARRAQAVEMVLIPLSIVAHRLDAYLKLPHGWRATPEGLMTDCYMWQQFYACEWIRASMIYVPTVIYLKRGSHPGLSTKERAEESRRFSELYLRDGGVVFYQSLINQASLIKLAKYHKRIANYNKRVKPFWKRLLHRVALK